MKRFLKLRHGEKGFTLIELLIVVAILGILAAVIIPNAAGFMVAGTLNAANTESANVKTASVGYMAENDGNWPATSAADGFDKYYTGTLKALYTFDVDGIGVGAGLIQSADPTIDGWGDGISWNNATQMWERAP